MSLVNPQTLLLLVWLSSIAILVIVPVALVALLLILRVFRQRAAARNVGVEASVADAVLGGLRAEVQSTLLAREQANERLRKAGEEAEARILTVMDTSIRIGDQASMLRFTIEVFPRSRPRFRAETQQAISDATRQKFMPGSIVFVRFDPQDTTQVALDRAAAAAADAPLATKRAGVVDCPSCGAAQHLTEDLANCNYCGRPLSSS